MPRDLSLQDDGNPTRKLQEAYASLMAEPDADALRVKVLALVKESKISAKNLQKFDHTVRGISTLEKLQFYVTNYILAGSGMSTGSIANHA